MLNKGYKDYNSKYDFGKYDSRKIFRYNPNSSIVDTLGEDIYFGLKDTKDNIAKTTSKLYDSSIGVLVNDKVKRGKFITVSATLLGGLTVAGVFNYLGADAAHARDYVAEKISSHSFKLETIAHASFALITFMTLSTRGYMKKQSYSFTKSLKLSAIDLAVLTAVSAPIALLGYEHFRGILVTDGIADGIDPRKAVLLAQLKLAIPYYVSVISSNKLLRYFVTDRLGITNGNSKNHSSKELITAKISPKKETLDNAIEKVS
jgi:hypothetical protein